MSGVEILGEIFAAAGTLVAVVPADQMFGGVIPQGAQLPALELKTISIVQLKTLGKGARRRVMERVQATVFARDYAEQKQIIRLVRNAADGQIGDFAGATDVDVQLDSTGPDFVSEAPVMWMASQDFMVSYNQAT